MTEERFRLGVLMFGDNLKLGAPLNKHQIQEVLGSPVPQVTGCPQARADCRVTPSAGISFGLQQVIKFTRVAEFSHTG